MTGSGDARRPRIYLAGPEVFFPNAREQGEIKKRLCAAHGFAGVYPLDNAIGGADADFMQVAVPLSQPQSGSAVRPDPGPETARGGPPGPPRARHRVSLGYYQTLPLQPPLSTVLVQLRVVVPLVFLKIVKSLPDSECATIS